MSSRVRSLVILGICALSGPVRAQETDRYWALFANGKSSSDNTLRDWSDHRKTPRLGNQALLDPRNPLRLLCDTSQRIAQSRQRVEMLNGDVLPGTVVRWEPAHAAAGLPDRLIVAIAEPLYVDSQPQRIAIRADRVRRIVRNSDLAGPLQPGALTRSDGQRVVFSALRYGPDGLRALTEDGMVAVTFEELAVLDLPARAEDALQALAEDALQPCPTDDGLLGRVTLANGAALTFREPMMIRAGHRTQRGHAPAMVIQPAWATESLGVSMDALALLSFREVSELPLSMLPGRPLAQRGWTGRAWPWRLNRSVRGYVLQSGSLLADLGVGTHSYSQIAFDLPAGARSFTALVGLSQQVGRGGCVNVSVHRGSAESKPLWEKRFLRGGSEPIRVGPVSLAGADRLVLVTDFAHEGRPRGADPLDIRDEVNWLLPTVSVDPTKLPTSPLVRWIPALTGWQVEGLGRHELQAAWNPRRRRWEPVLELGHDKPVTLRRDVTPSIQAGALEVVLGSAGQELDHRVTVSVDGKARAESLWSTRERRSFHDDLAERTHLLRDAKPGQARTVQVTLQREKNSLKDSAGLSIRSLGVVPLIANLPPSGKPIRPDVPLSKAKVLSAKWSGGGSDKPVFDAWFDGKPIEVNGVRFEHGLATRKYSEATFEIPSGHKQFVAVIGSAEGGSVEGFYVSIDGEQAYRSDGEGVSAGGVQVRVPIPDGAKQLHLTYRGDRARPVWAQAGFER